MNPNNKLKLIGIITGCVFVIAMISITLVNVLRKGECLFTKHELYAFISLKSKYSLSL